MPETFSSHVLEHVPMAVRIAARFLMSSGYFNIGDKVLYGRWKNHVGIVKAFDQDKWGNPTIVIEPFPRGRKHDVTLGLFKIWRADVKEKALRDQTVKTAQPTCAETPAVQPRRHTGIRLEIAPGQQP